MTEKKSTGDFEHVMTLSNGWNVYKITTQDAYKKEISQMKYDRDIETDAMYSYDHVYSIRDANGIPCIPFATNSNGKKEFGFALCKIPAKYRHAVLEFVLHQNISIKSQRSLRELGLIKVNDKLYELNSLPKEMIVYEDLDLRGYDLDELPNLSKWVICRNFDCSYNKLTSLKGCPQIVGRSFNCSDNKLTSLEGAPLKLGGYFNCSNNALTSLEGGPKKLTGSYNCRGNKLQTLKGAPKTCIYFNCTDNEDLESLEYAPNKLYDDLFCDDHLDGIPGNISLMQMAKREALLRGEILADIHNAAKQIDKKYLLNVAKGRASSKVSETKEKAIDAFYSLKEYFRN